MCIASFRNGILFVAESNVSFLQILVGVVELPTDFPVAKSMFPTTEVKNNRMRELQEYLRVVSTLCESRPPRAFVEFLGIDPDEVSFHERSLH